MDLHIHTHTHSFVYTHIHTHTHTHAYTHTHTRTIFLTSKQGNVPDVSTGYVGWNLVEWHNEHIQQCGVRSHNQDWGFFSGCWLPSSMDPVKAKPKEKDSCHYFPQVVHDKPVNLTDNVCHISKNVCVNVQEREREREREKESSPSPSVKRLRIIFIKSITAESQSADDSTHESERQHDKNQPQRQQP